MFARCPPSRLCFMLRGRPTALCLLWLSPYTRALSVPPRRSPPSPRGRRAAEGNYGRRPSRGQPVGGGGWRPSAQSSSPSWDDEDYEDDEQLQEAPEDGEFLFGVNPVLAALKQRRRKMYRLLVQARPCAWDVRGVCTACARRERGVCTAYARRVRGVCTAYARRVHAMSIAGAGLDRSQEAQGRRRRGAGAEARAAARSNSPPWKPSRNAGVLGPGGRSSGVPAPARLATCAAAQLATCGSRRPLTLTLTLTLILTRRWSWAFLW